MSKIKGKQLKVNLIYNAFYQILTLIVPLLTAPYISRVLGVSGVGNYGFTYSIAHYFVLFSMLGVLNYGSREMARVRNDAEQLPKSFWGIYSVQFSVGCTVCLAYVLYVCIFCDNYKTIFLFQGLYVLAGMLDISWFYFGIEEFKFTTGISAINKVVTTGLIFFLVKNENHVFIYTIIIAGGTLFNNIIYWCLLKKYIPFKKVSIIEIREHIKPLLLLFIPVIAVSLYKYMDKVMLGAMLSTTEVGIYESAEKFINLPMCVISAVGTVMLPRISNMKENNELDAIRRYNFASMVLVVFLSLGMSFGLAGISKVFIPWFYGNSFTKSADVLIVLVPSIVFVSWANVIRTQCLLPNKKDKGYCISVMIGALVNVVINTILIPKHGAIGAAIGTFISEVIVCVVQSIMCRKEMELIKYIKYSISFLFCAIAMYFVIINLNFATDFLTVFVRIIVGGMIYIISSVFFMKNVFEVYKNGNK